MHNLPAIFTFLAFSLMALTVGIASIGFYGFRVRIFAAGALFVTSSVVIGLYLWVRSTSRKWTEMYWIKKGTKRKSLLVNHIFTMN